MKERNNKWMKRLDKYIGCPLIFILGLFHIKRRFMDRKSKAPLIALLKTAAMGDTILMNAIIKEIKSNYPKSEITFICSKSNEGMAKALNDIDYLYCFSMKRPVESLVHLKSLGHFDLLFDFAPWARINALISYFLDADYKVGFKRKGMYRHYIYDAAVEHLDSVHEIENYRNILRAGHMTIYSFYPSFFYNKKPLITESYVVFHLYPAGSSVNLRMWDNRKWLRLGKEIYDEYGYTILVTGGKEDISNAVNIVEKLRKLGVSAKNIAGAYNLEEMKNVLGHAHFVISVNTGIMHMAAAVDVPLIALHGATSVKRWGPLNKQAYNLSSNESCQPCISLGFESKCKNPICMKHISVGMVMEKVKVIEAKNLSNNS